MAISYDEKNPFAIGKKIKKRCESIRYEAHAIFLKHEMAELVSTMRKGP